MLTNPARPFLAPMALAATEVGWRAVAIAIAVATLALIPLVLLLLPERRG